MGSNPLTSAIPQLEWVEKPSVYKDRFNSYTFRYPTGIVARITIQPWNMFHHGFVPETDDHDKYHGVRIAKVITLRPFPPDNSTSKVIYYDAITRTKIT